MSIGNSKLIRGSSQFGTTTLGKLTAKKDRKYLCPMIILLKLISIADGAMMSLMSIIPWLNFSIACDSLLKASASLEDTGTTCAGAVFAVLFFLFPNKPII
jgi:hypothetical protein